MLSVEKAEEAYFKSPTVGSPGRTIVWAVGARGNSE